VVKQNADFMSGFIQLDASTTQIQPRASGDFFIPKPARNEQSNKSANRTNS
jgi:hypothetical protein